MEKSELLELERAPEEGSAAHSSSCECLPAVISHVKCCGASRSLKYSFDQWKVWRLILFLAIFHPKQNYLAPEVSGLRLDGNYGLRFHWIFFFILAFYVHFKCSGLGVFGVFFKYSISLALCAFSSRQFKSPLKLLFKMWRLKSAFISVFLK